jgi:hypothetical protein
MGREGERSVKLFLPLALLLLTSLLLGATLTLTTKDFNLTTDLYRSDQAYYLAEAALARAKAQLAQDPAWRGEWTQIPLGPGTYSIRVTEQNGTVQIEAVGEVGKVKAVIKKSSPF